MKTTASDTTTARASGTVPAMVLPDIDAMTRAAMTEARKQRFISVRYPTPEHEWRRLRAVISAAVQWQSSAVMPTSSPSETVGAR